VATERGGGTKLEILYKFLKSHKAKTSVIPLKVLINHFTKVQFWEATKFLQDSNNSTYYFNIVHAINLYYIATRCLRVCLCVCGLSPPERLDRFG